MEANYPKRDSHFAHKTFRLMHKASVPAVIGRDAFCLVAVILHTEDAARYRGPVTFWNSQLMETLGFSKWETFDRARKRAVEAGWLMYSGDGKRSPGIYFVRIPEGYSMVNDEPIEDGLYPEIGYNAGYNEGYKEGYKRGYDAGIIGDINGGTMRGQSGVRCGDNRGYPSIPTPIPNPNPNPTPIPNPTPNTSAKRGRKEYSPEFEQFWNSFPARRRSQKKTAYSAWLKSNCDSLILISSAKEYAASDQGQSEFCVMPSTFLNKEMYLDDREAWKRINGNGKPPLRMDEFLIKD